MVWSWGLGAVSTAILVRWLTDPGSRDFDLGDLIALHASTCNELTETGRLCARHVLALLLPCSDWWQWAHPSARRYPSILYNRPQSRIPIASLPYIRLWIYIPHSSTVTVFGEAELLRRQPGAQVVRVDGAGHSVQGDQPIELARIIDAFVP